MDATGNKEVTHIDHAVRRRAGAACTRCRSRKVRCNLTSHGSPCTNCSLDGVPCTTRPSRRQKYGPVSSLELVSRNEFLSNDGLNLGSQMIHQIGLETGTTSKTTSKHKDQLSNNAVAENIAENTKISTNNPASSNSPHKSKSPASRLPSYFKPPPSFMIPEDVEHLNAIGAFSMPSDGLRDALLQSFLDYVHPLNAVLDVQDLFAMEGLTGDGKVSLLVFYTVMLGGSLYVDMKHLTEAGYATRRAARQSFYRKSKAVYDADYEQDKLCIAQALSLLSLWWETPSGHKGCWYWSGLAINLLHLVFLDNRRDEAKLGRKLTSRWKRLWWSCFIRDRTIGLGMKLPIRLSIVDYDMEVLELDDFDLEGATICQLSLKETTKLSWCPEKFRGLYTLFIEEAKLCICIDHLICVGRIESLNFESKIRELQSCESGLQNWRSQLPEVAALSLDLDITSDANSILIVHHATLRMMSYCVYAFIQRTYLILNLPDSEPLKATVLEMQNSSRTNISSTADTMTKIAKELQERDLIRYIPHSAVFSFVLVALMYLLDLTAVNDIEGISQSIHMMHFFRESYFDTEYMSRTVNLVFKRESIRRISHSGQCTLSGLNTLSSVPTPEGRNVSYDSPSHEWDIGHPAEISNTLDPGAFDLQGNDTNVLMQPSQTNLQEALNGSLGAEGLKTLDTLLASNDVNIDDLLMDWLNNEWDWNSAPLLEDIEMGPPQSQS